MQLKFGKTHNTTILKILKETFYREGIELVSIMDNMDVPIKRLS